MSTEGPRPGDVVEFEWIGDAALTGVLTQDPEKHSWVTIRTGHSQFRVRAVDIIRIVQAGREA